SWNAGGLPYHPCDVIKKISGRDPQRTTRYRGLVHCVNTIFRETSFKAFFKGGPARILRGSPQFGFTLAAYGLLNAPNSYPRTWKVIGGRGYGRTVHFALEGIQELSAGFEEHERNENDLIEILTRTLKGALYILFH
ncbi:mitochondrial aspartate-glutamate transporter agc1, partial [Rhizina undulata]